MGICALVVRPAMHPAAWLNQPSRRPQRRRPSTLRQQGHGAEAAARSRLCPAESRLTAPFASQAESSSRKRTLACVGFCFRRQRPYQGPDCFGGSASESPPRRLWRSNFRSGIGNKSQECDKGPNGCRCEGSPILSKANKEPPSSSGTANWGARAGSARGDRGSHSQGCRRASSSGTRPPRVRLVSRE